MRSRHQGPPCLALDSDLGIKEGKVFGLYFVDFFLYLLGELLESGRFHTWMGKKCLVRNR